MFLNAWFVMRHMLIFQVHKAKLVKNGQNVALKIQYPGVAKSIQSDLKSLGALIKVDIIIHDAFLIYLFLFLLVI